MIPDPCQKPIVSTPPQAGTRAEERAIRRSMSSPVHTLIDSNCAVLFGDPIETAGLPCSGKTTGRSWSCSKCGQLCFARELNDWQRRPCGLAGWPDDSLHPARQRWRQLDVDPGISGDPLSFERDHLEATADESYATGAQSFRVRIACQRGAAVTHACICQRNDREIGGTCPP
jgi:hypothetical protein